MSFELKEEKGKSYYIINSFEETNLVKHIFSTKIGWNLDNTIDNLLNIFNIYSENIAISNQVHDTNIVYVDDIFYYKKRREKEGIDGLITDKANIVLVTYYADCVPLFFLDTVNKVVGLAHAGWRGTIANIGGKMIKTMKEIFNSNPSNILVGIGPSIGPCCYEVGIDVYDSFQEATFPLNNVLYSRGNDKWYLNLWQANENILVANGVPKDNITVSRLCNSCNVDKFYSYRKEKGTKERMVAAIKLVG